MARTERLRHLPRAGARAYIEARRSKAEHAPVRNVWWHPWVMGGLAGIRKAAYKRNGSRAARRAVRIALGKACLVGDVEAHLPDGHDMWSSWDII